MARLQPVVLAALVVSSCTDVGVQPAPGAPPPELDDEITVVGSFCTDAPEDEEFPVKILFVIDTSGSMQFTDPGQQRATAVRAVVDRYAGAPAVEIGVIAFNGRVRNPTEGFTSNGGVLRQATDNELREADAVTDYQGALGMAYAVLLADMQQAQEESGSAELSRSKYVVVFFSDGTPQPACSASAEDPFLVCEFDKGDVNVPEEAFPELEAGRDYNQPYQILDKVEQIMELGELFQVGELRLHTALLYDEEEAAIAEEAFALDMERGRELLQSMAERGGGAFLSFYDGEEIDFLSLDYTQIKRSYVVKSFLLTNESVVLRKGVPEADTDRDGLSDLQEYELGTSALARDSDGDGYGDLLEVRLARRGYDALDRQVPRVRCGSRSGTGDPDRDGLGNCEEWALGTERLHPDSDADGLPDGVELVAGLDPANGGDADGDADQDGRRNRAEILAHLDPQHPDDESMQTAAAQYRYRLVETGTTYDGRTCYRFEVRHVQLLTPEAFGEEALGTNTLRLWLGQTPQDRPGDGGLFSTSCLKAAFVPPDWRTPLAPVWDLATLGEGLEARFLIPAADFNPLVHCIVPGQTELP